MGFPLLRGFADPGVGPGATILFGALRGTRVIWGGALLRMPGLPAARGRWRCCNFMKPNFGLVLTAIGLVGLAACGSSSGGGTTANKGTIKIGGELPESGKDRE